MENMKIYEAVRAVPEDAKKPINGGRLKGMTDINPMWRIKTLTEQFGACGFGWYYEVEKEWTEGIGEEVCAFVDIRLYVKVGDEWSKPIFGTGGSKLATSEKGGVYVSDECYKMAITDAISVACKQLGFGADVYWGKDRTKYTTDEEPKKIEKTPSREETIAVVNRFYPEGSDVRVQLLKAWGVEKVEDATNPQLMAVFNKYKGK